MKKIFAAGVVDETRPVREARVDCVDDVVGTDLELRRKFDVEELGRGVLRRRSVLLGVLGVMVIAGKSKGGRGDYPIEECAEVGGERVDECEARRRRGLVRFH